MKKNLITLTILGILLSSCVSKKKLTQAENKLQLKSEEISQLRKENDSIKDQVEAIEDKIFAYQAQVENLQADNENKLTMTEDGTMILPETRQKVDRILQNIDESKLASAKNFKDSLNIAISENIKSSLLSQMAEDSKTENANFLNVNVNQALVEIDISNAILFKSGSAFVKPSIYDLIENIANTINLKSNIKVSIVGHTDNVKVTPNKFVKDNLELSLKRAASVARILNEKFNVNLKRVLVSGASEYQPIADNSTAEGRAKNRRVTIKLVPNLKEFQSVLD
ncbi:flagellar motor protein MotB [Psychroflexus sp. ALD_RP9]|uniref:OmpA/MotB family protein n=1 Tax=Psychroflexus sp. ALD_RP9 TaxID=2777186 RepID=UPI001A8BFC35|nr:OmpA family protein [Psychroflexus sp. ALD_RP9]QSS97054.1 OmpA family protein [Psychroflexus sp. ALD_RP9]